MNFFGGGEAGRRDTSQLITARKRFGKHVNWFVQRNGSVAVP